MKIHAACMTMNELSDLIPNIEAILPHVHTLTIVDGGSMDLTIPYMRNLARRNPKVNFIISPWENDFPKQRNKYVAKIKEFAEPGDWLCTFDPDEYYAENTLKALPELIAEAETTGKTMIGLQCISQTFMGGEMVYNNLDAYHKTLIMKWFPEFKYGGFLVHESKEGIPHEIWDVHHNYYHRKQADVIWIRGFRNLVTGGGGPNLGHSNPRWGDLRQRMAAAGYNSWHELYAGMLRGNLDQGIKDWMLQYYNLEGFDGASEHREASLSYFVILHPEECATLSPEHQEYFRSKGARW